MQKFFTNFEAINQFTLSLDYHQHKLECRHCLKNDQFVSHGIVYKQRSISDSVKVGKRIFCSNRYGRVGCGHSFQLNVATKIPRLRYGTAQLFIFIASLLANLSIVESYQKATNQLASRNSWRWLNKLMGRLIEYRGYLKTRVDVLPPPFLSSSKRLQHLLPTLKRLMPRANICPCLTFQLCQQKPFI